MMAAMIYSFWIFPNKLIAVIFDVATHNFGVIIAIWAPVILVSGPEIKWKRKLFYTGLFWWFL